MPGELRVFASLRSAALERLDEELAALEKGGIDGYHIDVMDGRMVEEHCFDAAFVADLKDKTQKLIDVHLIAEEPEAQFAAYAEAGAARIAFHVEAVDDAPAAVARLRELGVQPGVVLFPSTPLDAIAPLLDDVAFINPLGVDPRQGLGFQEITYDRIAELVGWRIERALSFAIQADGGVWEKTRDALVAAGADELVGGYPIFSADDYGVAIAALRDGADAASAS